MTDLTGGAAIDIGARQAIVRIASRRLLRPVLPNIDAIFRDDETFGS